MSWIKKIIPILITVSLIYFFSNSFQVKGKPIPSLGKLLSPFCGYLSNAETSSNHLKAESFNFSNLKDEVNVTFDNRRVPHIYAQNIEDAYFIQGFLTASERLWQMDISARATGGQLSEIIGKKAINKDIEQRKKNILYSASFAEKYWTENKELHTFIKSYIDGVNQYVNSLSPKDYPLEFKLMGYAPSEWTITKMNLIMKAMALDLCYRHEDIKNSNTLSLFNKETFDFLFPEENPKNIPIIPHEGPWNFEVPSTSFQPFKEHNFFDYDIALPDEGLGSNNWVVDSTKSATGKPFLANDPHLSLTLPSIWFETHIHTPDMNVHGVSLCGIPGVTIGFNEDIAWGMTNVGRDVLDWYKIKWVDKEKTKYEVDGKVLDIEFRTEVIKIKGVPDKTISVKNTIWGPIVQETKNSSEFDLAMKWVGNSTEPNYEPLSIIGINKAKNYDDFYQSLQQFSAPAQNFIFASKKGTISINPFGKFPIKSEGQGVFILDGSKSENDWKGYIPLKHNPRSVNPKQGYLSSANQHTTGPDYPYYYDGGFDDYRGRILNRYLQDSILFTKARMQEMQNDNYSIYAEEFVAIILDNIDKSKLKGFEKTIIEKLKSWNFRYEANDKTPTIFTEVSKNIYKELWDEFYDVENANKIREPEQWRTLDILTNYKENIFIDKKNTPQKENVSDLIHNALKEVAVKYSKMDEVEDWYIRNNLQIKHLGKIAAFNSKVIETGGDRHALNALRNSFGPSWRMIVDLSQSPTTADAVFPGGQSGNPGSPFFDNMIEHWTQGKYYQIGLPRSPKEVKKPLFSVKFSK